MRPQRDYSLLDDTLVRWYVMLHWNPQVVDLMLKRENSIRQAMADGRGAVEYFIPFCFLSHVEESPRAELAADAALANQLREDFHDFVFIHTTERGIAMLLDRYWNKDLRNRLRYYRDFQHREVTISDREMNIMIRVFGERKLKYTIGLPVPDLSPDMNVYIRTRGIFNGQQARVVEVKHMADGISLTLGVQMFQGTRELKLPDFRLAGIQTERKPEDIIGHEFIRETEATLIDILSRRVNHKETDETRRQDADTLNSRFLYSYIAISDTAVAAHFLALMLICSTLRFDRESTRTLTARAQALLDSAVPLPPRIQAYLHLSLYIATRDADHRTAAKQCMQQNQSVQPILPMQHRQHAHSQHVHSQFVQKQCVQQNPEEQYDSLVRLASLAGRLRGKRKRNNSRLNIPTTHNTHTTTHNIHNSDDDTHPDTNASQP